MKRDLPLQQEILLKAAEDPANVRLGAFGDRSDKDIADQVEYLEKEGYLDAVIRRSESGEPITINVTRLTEKGYDRIGGL